MFILKIFGRLLAEMLRSERCKNLQLPYGSTNSDAHCFHAALLPARGVEHLALLEAVREAEVAELHAPVLEEHVLGPMFVLSFF